MSHMLVSRDEEAPDALKLDFYLHLKHQCPRKPLWQVFVS